jgi:predicted O-methyltransferase YrrM
MKKNDLAAYAAGGRSKVNGWFSRVDAEIFRLLLEIQRDRGVSGGVAEIGVHHGKSLILLAMALRNEERALCIDLFSKQSENLDQSGQGDLQQFLGNVDRFNVDRRRLVIMETSSLDVRASDVKEAIGAVRFFSVDGGHWLEAARSDLALAEECLSDEGIIALDDFHRPEWPDVSAGFFSWYKDRQTDLVPFLIGFNKLYICRADHASRYSSAVLKDKFLAPFVAKHVSFLGVHVPVLSTFPFPEFSLSRRIAFYFRVYFPSFYVLFSRRV